MIGGIVLLLVGVLLSLPGIPGPGIVVVVLGLGLLSSEFTWADRLYTRLKKMGQDLVQRTQSHRAGNDEPEGPTRSPTPRQGRG